jgi:hypothetical protein
VREEQRWIVVHEQVAELPELESDARTEREPVFLAVELDVLVSAPDDLDDVPDHIAGCQEIGAVAAEKFRSSGDAKDPRAHRGRRK